VKEERGRDRGEGNKEGGEARERTDREREREGEARERGEAFAIKTSYYSFCNILKL